MKIAHYPEKPLYGDPCNGCGLCCVAIQCPISTALFGEQKLCPALEDDGSRLSCGLIRDTAAYVSDLQPWGGKVLTEAFGLMIGAGGGCDGTIDTDTPERIAAFRPLLHARAAQALEAASPEARELVGYFRPPHPKARASND